MNIVTPSKWLSNLVEESFLSCYPIITIHNGIDLNVFKPTKGNIRAQYDCKDKYIILGVAFGWNEKKGLNTFIELAKVLDEKYQIILVGTDYNVEKTLPPNIISIQKTTNQYQLVELYTAADVFVNPTKQDVLGLVNIEALACGTPVIVNNIGGCPECIDDTCGIVIKTDKVDVWKKAIEDTISSKKFSRDICRKKAEMFDAKLKYKEYLDLYEAVL